jgi:hypothetical protein
MLAEPGAANQYEEVGDVGGLSTSIKIGFDAKAGDLITYVIFS